MHPEAELTRPLKWRSHSSDTLSSEADATATASATAPYAAKTLIEGNSGDDFVFLWNAESAAVSCASASASAPQNLSLYGGLLKSGGGPGGAAALFLIFLAFVAATGLCPMMYQNALYDPLTRKKSITFVPCLPHALAHTLSSFVGLVACVIFGKSEHITDLQAICFMAPAAVCNGFSDSGEILCMKYLDGGMRAVLNQARLPLITAIRRIGFNFRQSLQQWILISSISMAVVTYVLAKLENGGDSGNSGNSDGKTLPMNLAMGLAIVSFVIISGVCGSTWGEYLYKRQSLPMYVKLYQIRLASCLVGWMCSIFAAVKMGVATRLFEGFNCKLLVLVVFIAARDIFYIGTLLYLDAFWNGLANSVSVAVAFGTDVWVFGEPFSWHQFCLILLILMLVAAYSVAKADDDG